MSDYKSRELNIFSADAKNKLRVVSESHAVLESDVFKFKYGLASHDGKGDVTGNMPIYIPKLAADVNGTAVYISDWLWQDRQTITAEQSRALAAESVLQADTKSKYELNLAAINQEVSRASFADSKHAIDIATEILARQQADSQLTTALTLEQSARESGFTALSSLIAENQSYNVAQLASVVSDQEEINADFNSTFAEVQQSIRNEEGDRKLAIQAEATARLDADALISVNISHTQNLVMVEAGRAQTVEAQLQAQISSLLSNTDAVALNSLAELVTDYRANGGVYQSSLSALTDRMLFLEGVIADLVARTG